MFLRLIFTLCAFLLVGVVFGQPPFPIDPPSAPIDGGLSWLLAAGAAYGAKKIYDYRKDKEQDDEDNLEM